MEGSTVVMRVVEVFEDDLEGGKADVTVAFALDGTAYEIDLSDSNAQRLRDALEPFVTAGRPVVTTRQVRRSTGRGAADSAAQVREWARSHGYEVNERGRIPATVQAAYRAAHSGS
jgi:Lsr2